MREDRYGFFVVGGSLPISKEGSLFIGWMEMRLQECIDSENYEEANRLKIDIKNAKDNIKYIWPKNENT